MPNQFGGRQLIADLATVDTNGAWLLDDEFAELCSEVLQQKLTARDVWRAWFTPAGGTYPDDCEFTLLRSRVGDLVHDDEHETPRYAYCVNVQRVQRTLQSTCICGSEQGDYAKKKWPTRVEGVEEAKHPLPSLSSDSTFKQSAGSAAAHVHRVRKLMEEFSVSTYDPNLRALPIEKRPPSGLHKLKCPLWAFSPHQVSPMKMNFLMGLVDKDGDPIKRELKDIPLVDRPMVDVLDESLYPVARDEDDILYVRPSIEATTAAIEERLKRTAGMYSINSGADASRVRFNDTIQDLAPTAHKWIEVDSEIARRRTGRDNAEKRTRRFHRTDDPPPRTVEEIMAEADEARATIGQRRDTHQPLTVMMSKTMIGD
jgi:hypothetical protein